MRMREREKQPPTPAPLKDKSLDITTEERLYSRSLKIRTGILACLFEQATEKQLMWDSLESLGGYCGNYIARAGWQEHAASSVSCVRWLKQYLNYNGPFKIQPAGSGTFLIGFRAQGDRAYVAKEIKNVRLSKPRKRAEKPAPPPAPVPARAVPQMHTRPLHTKEVM